ncbi:MAG: DUF3306 domain-containing protein [Paracoccaceae bacterium]
MSQAAPQRNFWSDRKARVLAEQQAEEQAVVAEVEATELAEQEAKSDEVLLEELGLPDPDELKLGDDIKGFMSKAVPDRLRRRALRQLWRLNPVLANVDGLVDYGEDFTDSATVIENLQTAYQVGKGMLKHVEEMARQAEARLEVQAENSEDVAIEDEAAEADVEAAEPHEEQSDTPEPLVRDDGATDLELDADVANGTPRRMRFHYAQSPGACA